MTRSLLWSALLLGSAALAQELPVPLNEAVVPVQCAEASAPCEAFFWIDANSAVTFRYRSARRDLRLVFTNAEGLRWEIAAPSGDLAEAGSPELCYETSIEKPDPGRWHLAVTAPPPGIPPASLSILFRNGISARLTTPRTTVVSGDPIPVMLDLQEGERAIRGAMVTATLTRPEDTAHEQVSVPFAEEGAGPASLAGKALYTAVLAALPPGTYRLEARIEAFTSAGRSQRTASLRFQVIPKAARITGAFTQRILAGTPD